MPRQLEKSEALYKAAFAGQIEVVLRLLADWRTKYFRNGDDENNSYDAKALIIAIAIYMNVVKDETIDPQSKRIRLLEITSQIKNRHKDDDYCLSFLDKLNPILSKKFANSTYIHYDANYLSTLDKAQICIGDFYTNFWRFFAQNSAFHLPKEVWSSIIVIFVSATCGAPLNPSDYFLLFRNDLAIASPTQFSIPTKDGKPRVVEVPMSTDFDKIAIFRTIHDALYAGQQTVFKLRDSELMDKPSITEKEITDFIVNHPKSRVAKAWELTCMFVFGRLSKEQVFQKTYESTNRFTLFKSSTFAECYNETVFNQGLTQSLASEKDLGGTRTKVIIDELAKNPSLSLSKKS